MRAKIFSKQKVAKETLEVKYDLLGKQVAFKAGQYFYVTLPGGLKHHFTIVNSPNEKGILSHTTRLRDTEFKNTLQGLPLGTEVEVGEIGGRFTLPEAAVKPLTFIALGIGITPYISMLKFIEEENKNFKITLIYSDHDKQSLAYLGELEAYAKKKPNFRLVVTITGGRGSGEHRHVSGEFIRDYLENIKKYLYFVSGPPHAVDSVAASLEEAGIDEENIKTENFSGY